MFDDQLIMLARLTLDEAQHNNFDLICRKLELAPGDRRHRAPI